MYISATKWQIPALSPLLLAGAQSQSQYDLSSKAQLTFISHLTSPLVKVTVGTGAEQKTYNLHKSLVIEKSEYFRACLQGGFAEADTREVTLWEEKSSVFDWFAVWLYNGNFGHFGPDAGCNDAFIGVYILADRLLCTELKDNCIDILLEFYTHNYVGLTPVIPVFEQLSESHLADLLIHQVAFDLFSNYHYTTSLPAFEALLEVDGSITKRIMDRLMYVTMTPGGRHAPKDQHGCTWHEHERTDRECSRRR